MPIYEFHCAACEINFEELVGLGSSAPCPKCGTGDVAKLYSTFAAPRSGPAAQATSPHRGQAPFTGPANLENVSIVGDGYRAGVHLGPGVHITSRNLFVEGAQTAVHNEGGTFEHVNTVIK